MVVVFPLVTTYVSAHGFVWKLVINSRTYIVRKDMNSLNFRSDFPITNTSLLIKCWISKIQHLVNIVLDITHLFEVEPVVPIFASRYASFVPPPQI